MTTQHDSADDLSEFTEMIEVEADYSGHVESRSIDPKIRRRWLRAFLIVGLVIVLALGSVGAYVAWALTAPVRAADVSLREPAVPTPEAAVIALPADGASIVNVVGGDEYLGGDEGGTWLASGPDESRSIASISKLITALVVLDAKPLADAGDSGPTITFDKAAHDLYDKYYVMGATIAPMPTGTAMSEYDALATMLIPSASNYAEAVSTWAFGSQNAFVGAARAWLNANGLNNTTIVEPTGISPNNTSTPNDLMAIARLVDANPALKNIVATSSISVPGGGTAFNTNNLLGVDGIDGLKTGNLGEGQFNLLYTATLSVGIEEPLRITGVALGGATHESVNAGVRAVLDDIRAGFHDVPLIESGEVVGSYSTPWGSTAQLVVGSDASIFTWSDTPIELTMDTWDPTEYVDGEEAGSLTWTAGPNTATAPLQLSGEIEPPTAWWRLTHPDQLGS
ncbi:D-alanyl-D-alanine carboxypeptidase (penicillin-binding protein 5/6) [Microbacterium halimionae]|uniref:D-alanyl-D-alanine carboxypeptidase (Penicillin-binding protein 5/6) n=1 Tax=Microbacterium halimionae TaxID=1526413 RepID=A0A7W3PMM3_9MICO|nr:D-alanyl-D-alanine carboxypeptidase [Microbacterium halimionae]MBA8817211.1 D-alanyl-D-alanine carboxypeptidase (penicillin-binding protein 5/6) [Microbacterium halimionae]NII94661.1 D-alanyl-D-alanine carboxypeptidase (penicillin-binding protein 5/6) [Microbacterium halimionae]